MQAFLQWLPIGAILINLLVAWAAWSIRASARQEMSKVSSGFEERLADHNTRLQLLEVRAQYVPDHEDLQRLHERISEIRQQVNGVASEVSGIHSDIGGLKESMRILIRHHIPEGGATRSERP